jgi:hypothetical protein
MAERIFTGDTAILTSALLEEDETNLIPIRDVDLTVVDPNERDLLVSELPSDPSLGDVIGLKLLITPFQAWDIIKFDGNN